MLKNNLKMLLKQNNMTQSKLSELTGIRPGTITNIVNNRIKQIPVEAACKICDVLGCDIGDIWYYEADQDKK